MSESLWEPEAAVESAHNDPQLASAEPAPLLENAQHGKSHESHAEPAALAVSLDDFAALEERVRRAVDLVKHEREARAAAEARIAEWEARAVRAESQVQSQSLVMENLENDMHALRAERDQVRQRVERLLKQLDSLEL